MLITLVAIVAAALCSGNVCVSALEVDPHQGLRHRLIRAEPPHSFVDVGDDPLRTDVSTFGDNLGAEFPPIPPVVEPFMMPGSDEGIPGGAIADANSEPNTLMNQASGMSPEAKTKAIEEKAQQEIKDAKEEAKKANDELENAKRPKVEEGSEEGDAGHHKLHAEMSAINDNLKDLKRIFVDKAKKPDYSAVAAAKEKGILDEKLEEKKLDLRKTELTEKTEEKRAAAAKEEEKAKAGQASLDVKAADQDRERQMDKLAAASAKKEKKAEEATRRQEHMKELGDEATKSKADKDKKDQKKKEKLDEKKTQGLASQKDAKAKMGEDEAKLQQREENEKKEEKEQLARDKAGDDERKAAKKEKEAEKKQKAQEKKEEKGKGQQDETDKEAAAEKVRKDENAELAKESADEADAEGAAKEELASLTAKAGDEEADLAKEEAAKEADKLIQAAREATQKEIEGIEADATTKAVSEEIVKAQKSEQKRESQRLKDKEVEEKMAEKRKKELEAERKHELKHLKGEVWIMDKDEKTLSKRVHDEEKKVRVEATSLERKIDKQRKDDEAALTKAELQNKHAEEYMARAAKAWGQAVGTKTAKAEEKVDEVKLTDQVKGRATEIATRVANEIVPRLLAQKLVDAVDTADSQRGLKPGNA